MNGHTFEQLDAVYYDLLCTARANGYKPGWADYKFRDRYGEFPVQELKDANRKMIRKCQDKAARMGRYNNG